MARDPERSIGILLKVVLSIIGVITLLMIIALGMISTLADTGKNINDEFQIKEEQLYKDIEEVYLEYQDEMQKKMNTREAEIIETNTEVVETDDSTTTVCNVTVSKQFTPINYAHVFAYINHAHQVKEGISYTFNKNEIKGFFESIAPLKETYTESHYSLYNDLCTPKEVAELYFTMDDDRQMYVQSYTLYASFLEFAGVGSADGDMGSGSEGSPGFHLTHVPTADESFLIESCNDDISKKVVEFAFSKLGYPYSQAQRHDGAHFDCSSLCYYAYASAGVDISSGGSSTAAALASYCSSKGQTLGFEQLQPGDLIFYCCNPGNGRFMGIDHVAIYVGEGKIIDASSSKGYVVYRDIFWKDRIVLCGRPR